MDRSWKQGSARSTEVACSVLDGKVQRQWGSCEPVWTLSPWGRG